MPAHTCCELDLKRLVTDIKETAAEITALKKERREAKLLQVGDPARDKTFWRTWDAISRLKPRATMLCTIRARHRKLEHMSLARMDDWQRKEFERKVEKLRAEYMPKTEEAAAEPATAVAVSEIKKAVVAVAVEADNKKSFLQRISDAARQLAPAGKKA